MKYIKILAMLLLPLLMTACSDDENINGGNAKVGFANGEISLRENTTEFKVPIAVTGEHTGLIKVTLEVRDVKGSGLKDDSSIIVTSKNLLIPAGTESINVEIRTAINTTDEDPGREFSLVITSCEGAAIDQATCKVNVVEAIDAYDKLPGTWTLEGVGESGSETFAVEVIENEKGNGYDCYSNYQGAELKWAMTYNPSGVTIVCNEIVADNLNFGGDLGVCSVSFAAFSGSNLSWDGVPGVWSDDFNTITFTTGLAGAIMKNGNFSGYIWFGYNTCKMTR